MRIHLAYGKQGLEVDLNDRWNVSVVEPKHPPPLPDPKKALEDALLNPLAAPPLRQIVKSTDRVGIVFSDITRPAPNHLMIPAILRELSHVSEGNITLFNGLGTHRPQTPAELREMLGSELVERYRIVQNSAFDPSTQVRLGTTTEGHEVWLNRDLVECDVKILTGFIEPHFFAGFSGGGKAVMPGMAGLQTILGNHDARMIGSPKATWGITRGNPIWEEIQEAASWLNPTFLLNVTLDSQKRITGVFAGDWQRACEAGCAFAKETAMVAVPEEFDIVVTTNSGYPLDLNLYQTVKGMSAAAQIVKKGGTILAASECWDGIPDHGLYRELLIAGGSPQGVLEMISRPGFLKQDQWQAQIQAQIQLKADVFVYSDHLTDAQIAAALLCPCRSVENTLASLIPKYGRGASICVLPQGPQTIPYVVG
ncbi:MAG TPA: nickel-dependent lactate racemase [Acidobacteriota bacterium]|nr:nickel-dependent lactate racemase [Acidobacteriota bacterium]